MADTATQDAGHLARVAVLRWYGGKDFDQTKLRPSTEDTLTFDLRALRTRHVVWPMGRKFPPLCASHFDATGPTAHMVWQSLAPVQKRRLGCKGSLPNQQA